MADAPAFQAPPGTRDITPPESSRWEELVARFGVGAERAGYGYLITPLFEERGVFSRGVGTGTDIVTKEMYEFEDRGGRHLALRPEVTASVVRAFVQHRPTVPWKVWYWGPNFRYERPQAGRYRQFFQLGVEVLGADDPDLDVEVVALAWDFYLNLGLRRVELLVNSLGDGQCRPAYRRILLDYLEARSGALCDEHRTGWRDNPLRVLDCKKEPCRTATAEAPAQIDHLCGPCSEHWERVLSGLKAVAVPYTIRPRLVRGLDYYTRTTFEFAAGALDAAQNAIGGGGRYNGLVEGLGGRPTPGIGFSIGVERLLLAADAEQVFPVPAARIDAFVVDVVGGAEALVLSHELRDAGIGADRAFGARSMKAQMKAADRSGAAVAVIVGESERDAGTVMLRALRRRSGDGGQQEVPRTAVVERVRAMVEDIRGADQ